MRGFRPGTRIATPGILLQAIVPSAFVLVLFTLLPPPPEALRWMARAWSPIALWALVHKADMDSRLFGVLLRRRYAQMPNRPLDIVSQIGLAVVAVLLAWAPF